MLRVQKKFRIGAGIAIVVAAVLTIVLMIVLKGPAQPDSELSAAIRANVSAYSDPAKTGLSQVTLAWGDSDSGNADAYAGYEVRWKISEPPSVTAPPESLAPAGLYEPLTRLFDRREKPFGWLGGDGGSSARLYDGRDAWAFSDSAIGIADSEGRFLNWTMVRNCLIFTDTADGDYTMFDARWGVSNTLSLDDAAFVQSIGSWEVSAGEGALSLTTEQALFGTHSLKVEQSASEDLLLSAQTGKQGSAIAIGKPVSAKVRVLPSQSSIAILGIAYYDANGAIISRQESEQYHIPEGEWMRLDYTGSTAPARAAYATLFIRFVGGDAGDQYYIANAGVYIGDAALQSWSLPGRGLTFENLVNVEEVNLVTPSTLQKEWFWFSGAVSVGTKLYVFLGHYGENDGTPPWNFEFKYNQYVAQWDTEANVFEGVFPWSEDDPAQWGSTFYQDDEFVYTTGFVTETGDHYVMRAPANDLFGQKQYWSGSAWSESRADASPVIKMTNGGTIDGMVSIGGGFQGVYIPSFGTQVKRVQAETITGPWIDTGEAIYDIPVLGDGVLAYIPRIHTQFTTPEGIVMSYSSGGDVNGEARTTYSFPKFFIGPPSGSAVGQQLSPSAGTQSGSEPGSQTSSGSGSGAGESGSGSQSGSESSPHSDPQSSSQLGKWSKWSKILRVDGDRDGVNIDDLPTGYNLIAEVRGISRNGGATAWKSSGVIQVVDRTAPARPSKPVVSLNTADQLQVEWDGRFTEADSVSDSAGDSVEDSRVDSDSEDDSTADSLSDFVNVEIHVSEINHFLPAYWTKYATMTKAGKVVLEKPLSSERTYYVRFVAVDAAGNASIASEQSEITTNQINTAENAVIDAELRNGSFEQQLFGQLPNWVESWWIGKGIPLELETEKAISGNSSLRLSPTVEDGRRVASNVFTVTAHDHLLIRAKLSSNRLLTSPVMEVALVTADTPENTGGFHNGTTIHWIPVDSYDGNNDPGQSYKLIEADIIIPEGQKYGRVYLSALPETSTPAPYVGWFDDVEIIRQ